MTSQRKVVLVTGASRGIGLEVAKEMIAQGYFVVGCSRSQSEYRDSSYIHMEADLACSDKARGLIKAVKKKFGRLDVLVNNAAINPSIRQVSLVPLSTLEEVFRVNFFTPFQLCAEALKLMQRQKNGRIINLGSMAVKHEVEGESVYTSSKAALQTFTRILAKESYRMGVTCNMVAPAAVATDLSSQIDSDALQAVLQRNACKEMGRMEEIVNLIVFLSSEEASGVTSQVIYLGGV